jgi:transcriptional regulator with XRE-family HTH domain
MYNDFMNIYTELGGIIRKGRVGVGLDQRKLADCLDVEQQTVSRWELGQSRPRSSALPQLARALQMDIAVLRHAGRYEVLQDIPLHNLVQLPFENLSPDDFERCICSLMQVLYSDVAWSRNGVSGDKQDGFDVISSGSDYPKVQCKRERQFGPKKVERAVGEVPEGAKFSKGVIALSRPATAQTRKKMQEYPNWELWDSEDLCSRIRDIPQDKATRLVDAYFPGWRKPFLGLPEPTPWLTAEEFSSLVTRGHVIREVVSIQGRQSESHELAEGLQKDQTLVLVVGRGGIGKTRLVLEYAHVQRARTVVFYDHSPLTAKAFELLPDGDPIVVLDDCISRNDNIRQIVEGVYGQRPNANVVATIREEDIDRFQQKVPGFQIIKVKVGDLSRTEARLLAHGVIGDGADDVAVNALAAIGYDCPLLIMLGGQMVRDRRLDPRYSQPRRELAQEIMKQYRDSKIKVLGDREASSVAQAIAALQPVRLDDTEMLHSLCCLSRIPESDIFEVIDSLESSGLILRQQDLIRIIPNLLGEALLERALIGQTAHDTGYAQKLVTVVTGGNLHHALRNVSIVDWQQQSLGNDLNLTTRLWDAATQNVLLLPNTSRIKMIRSLEEMASVAPSAALTFAEQIISFPAADEVDSSNSFFGDITTTSKEVNLALTQLIANAGYGDNLERAMRLLWDIGKDDARKESQTPEHGLRLLAELGSHQLDRPLSAIEQYISVIESWLVTVSAREKARMIKMLSGALELEAKSTEWAGDNSLRFAWALIDRPTVQGIRTRVLSIASEQLKADTASALAAIDLLRIAVNEHGKDQSVDDEAFFIVGVLTSCLQDDALDPAIRLGAYEALGWPSKYRSGPFSDECLKARKGMIWDFNLRMERQIRPDWLGSDMDADDNDGKGVSDRLRDSAITLAHEIHERFESDDALIDWLIPRLMADRIQLEKTLSDLANQFGTLMEELLALRPGLARAFQRVINPGTTSIVEQTLLFHSLLALMRSSSNDAAHALQDVFDAGNFIFIANVITTRVDGLSWLGDWLDRLIDLQRDDVDLVILRRMHGLAGYNIQLCQSIILRLGITRSSQIAGEIAGMLRYGHFKWTDFSHAIQGQIVRQLAESPELRQSVVSLFNEMKSVHAALIVNALIGRIEKEMDLPYDFFLDLDGSDDIEATLSLVIEASMGAHPRVRPILARLFRGLVREYGPVVQGLLLRLIRSGSDDSIDVCTKILQNAPTAFPIANVPYVNQIIETSKSVLPQAVPGIRSAIFRAATSRMKTGIMGEAFPEDIALRDTCQRILADLQLNEDSRKLYEALRRHAEGEISREIAPRDMGSW